MILLLAVPNSVFAATSFILQAKAEGNVVILSHTIYQTYGSAPFSVDKGDYTVAGEVQNNGEGAPTSTSPPTSTTQTTTS